MKSKHDGMYSHWPSLTKRIQRNENKILTYVAEKILICLILQLFINGVRLYELNQQIEVATSWIERALKKLFRSRFDYIGVRSRIRKN